MKILCVLPLSEENQARFRASGAELIYRDRAKAVREDLEGCDAVLGNLPFEWINSASSIRWVQLDSAGIGNAGILRPDIVLTNASGAYGEAIGEYMTAQTLAVMKKLYQYYDGQKEHRWENLGTVPVVSEMNILSVGMGDIGFNYAWRMHLLGAHVAGIRRTEHRKEDWLDQLGTMKDLDRMLPEYDVVALSLPETNETRHIIDAERFDEMKKGAILINVGRGSAIDENALIHAMKNHRLSAAVLDVTEREPLPENSPLWETENVFITPHISGRFNAEVTYDKIVEIFYANLIHFIHGKPLEHTVDIKRGY